MTRLGRRRIKHARIVADRPSDMFAHDPVADGAGLRATCRGPNKWNSQSYFEAYGSRSVS